MDARTLNRPTSLSRRESGIVQRVRASLTRGGMGREKPRVLIACSGGQDSVALVQILAGLARRGAFHAEIVHVDHGVRDDSGDAAAGVRHIGASLGLMVHTEILENESIQAHGGVGAEEALRRERYLAFSRVAQQCQADQIALAHHQRDQAETVLLHLIRGTGLHGAAGMRKWSTIDVPWWPSEEPVKSLTLWRPFLAETWDDVGEIARESDLPIFDDSTNSDRRYRRNAIRHDVLPLLESISPAATANIARFAELADEDNAELERIAMDQLRLEKGDLHRGVLLGVSLPIQRRIVRRWILSTSYNGELTMNRIDAIRDMADRNRSGAVVEIGAGWRVRLSHGRLTLHQDNEGTIGE